MRKLNPTKPALVGTTHLSVRFSEVDSMKVVWHGNYARYFEDGREAFGRQFAGLGYMNIAASGFTAPIVELHIDYKQPLHCDDEAVVETRYIDTGGAKIYFEYEIRRASDNVVVATGNTVQVFLDSAGELQLLSPAFYLNWKSKWIR